MSNIDIENATVEMDPAQMVKHMAGSMQAGDPNQTSKVFRSWSRPQINSNELPGMSGRGGSEIEGAGAGKSTQFANGKVLKTI